MSKNSKYLIAIVVCIIIIVTLLYGFKGTGTTNTATNVPAGWATTTDTTAGVSFAYPLTLNTQYIKTVDWPPKVSASASAFTCTEAGSPSAPAGQTVQSTINGHSYCVTTETQGAAGSIYSLYAYAFPSGSKTVIFTFALQYPQCANYPDPNKSACTSEEASFSVDTMVDQMAQSVSGL